MQQTEKASIKYGGTLINYTIIRSARRKKTVEITLNSQNGVVVRAPINTTSPEIAGLINKRAEWILQKSTTQILNPQQRQFLNGETLPFLGSPIPHITTPTTSTNITIQMQNGAIHITVPDQLPPEDRPPAISKAIQLWYQQSAAQILPQFVQRWQNIVTHRKPTQVIIRDQRKRWGSCSTNGVIRLNWRLIMAHPDLIDYVAVHELAHLNVMNHSPQFWQHVERIFPDYRARRKRLNQDGIQFWL